MSNYTKTTNFLAKDSLPENDSGKIIKGSEFDVEFNALQVAVNTKADTASPTFTGVPTAPTATAGTNTTQLATTAFVKTGIDALGTMSTQNASAVAITGGTITGLSSALPVASGGTGLATLTANNVILGNGTSNPSFVAPGTTGNVLTSNGTTWSSQANTTPWFVSNVNSSSSITTNTTSYTITANTLMVLGTAYHPMSGNSGSSLGVRIKNSGGTTLFTYTLTGGNEFNGGDGGSGMSSRSAWSVAVPSAAIGGTLEFFRESGSNSITLIINQVVKSA